MDFFEGLGAFFTHPAIATAAIVVIGGAAYANCKYEYWKHDTKRAAVYQATQGKKVNFTYRTRTSMLSCNTEKRTGSVMSYATPQRIEVETQPRKKGFFRRRLETRVIQDNGADGLGPGDVIIERWYDRDGKNQRDKYKTKWEDLLSDDKKDWKRLYVFAIADAEDHI